MHENNIGTRYLRNYYFREMVEKLCKGSRKLIHWDQRKINIEKVAFGKSMIVQIKGQSVKCEKLRLDKSAARVIETVAIDEGR